MAAGCSRSARPVPVPESLRPWPTALETPRRSAWLDEQAPEHPERAWTVELGRGVQAPIAIASDLIVATTIDRRVIVLAAQTGSMFWQRRLAGAAPGSAVFDRQAIYTGAQDREGAAEAYELERGFMVWRREMEPPVGAPLLADGITYWGTETGRVYALNASDGSRLWRLDLPGGVVHTPVPDGGDLLVTTSADSLYRIDARTGRIGARLALPSTPTTALPAFDGTLLHLPMHDSTHVVVDTRAWRIDAVHRLDAPARGGPVLDRDGSAWLLTDHATVWRVDRGGARVVAELGGAARASLALARNGVLVGRLDGTLFLLRRDGTVVWQLDLGDSLDAPVAIYRGAIYAPLLRGELVMLREGDA